MNNFRLWDIFGRLSRRHILIHFVTVFCYLLCIFM